ncbi:type II toxin-antitoxin system Phd/YefM family antitoxin [Streptomyces shenzhenensis]|uniref:type II toxin-antitoxin system Phd/YefM family antitoxin n=1 Tax=Streptomyces shenzhenensis TaxID=943815 RepID=UPI002867DEDC|nr:hypothetical protein [Streptomyces shenzhenensis]
MLAAAARGETVTVTRIGTPVARVVSITENDVPPFPTGPLGTQSFPTSACPISAMTKSRKRRSHRCPKSAPALCRLAGGRPASTAAFAGQGRFGLRHGGLHHRPGP